MKFKTTDGAEFESEFNLKSGDAVLLEIGEDNAATLDRFLPADYVENWSGSASTLETDGKEIHYVA